MALDRITLTRFRNHDASRLDGSGKLNLLYGENGAGKTNGLEALSLLAPGRGLRRAVLAEMAEDGPNNPGGGFAVSAELDCGDGREPVTLGTGTSDDKPGRRVVQVNGAETSAAARCRCRRTAGPSPESASRPPATPRAPRRCFPRH